MTSFELLGNRVDFKLYCCEQHLNTLKNIKAETGSLLSQQVRLQAEMEIDEFFYQLISAKDSLLQEINAKLALGIDVRKVNLEEINIKLKSISKEHVVAELKAISDEQSWLWLVNEFHNQSKHRNIINKQFVRVIGTSSGDAEHLLNPKTRQPVQEDIFDYLKESLENMQNLVANARSKIV